MKMKGTKQKKLPNMSGWTDEQIAEFWEHHDATDYWREMEPVEITFRRRQKESEQKRLTLRLTANQWKRLKGLADRQGITPERLVWLWIDEHLKAAK